MPSQSQNEMVYATNWIEFQYYYAKQRKKKAFKNFFFLRFSMKSESKIKLSQIF